MSQLFSDTDEQAVQDIINPWEKGNSGDESNRANVASETESIKKKKWNGIFKVLREKHMSSKHFISKENILQK